MKYIITFGSSQKVFYTNYHAEQFARALRLNGTQFELTRVPLGASDKPAHKGTVLA